MHSIYEAIKQYQLLDQTSDVPQTIVNSKNIISKIYNLDEIHSAVEISKILAWLTSDPKNPHPGHDPVELGSTTPEKEIKNEIVLSSVIIPETAIARREKIASGFLVTAHATAWGTIVDLITKDESLIYNIPSHVWEEIIAGAFSKEGFDSVVLTPRSKDHGRDVIATRTGFGSIKVIGSVKAYKKGRTVTYDDVRALMGVLASERDASKGVITTTSGFPPKIKEDPLIAPLLPTRLDLLDGEAVQKWLAALRARDK